MRDYQQALERIDRAFDRAEAVLRRLSALDPNIRFKGDDDPVTDVDEALDHALHESLASEGDEGWLSEETVDDSSRLGCSRVWIVDPLDGTREFVAGIPEWCVSVALSIDSQPVAGGIYAPAAGLRVLGALGHGVRVNGHPASCRRSTQLAGALVLASRSEVGRGDWDPFFRTEMSIRNMGSIALKAAQVGAGLADATFSLTRKNEWDVAAGSAIVLAGGGRFSSPDGTAITFNNADPLLDGYLAAAPGLHEALKKLISSVEP